MKVHVEYDDFGEYVEAYDGENLYVLEEHTIGKTVELILFKEAG